MTSAAPSAPAGADVTAAVPAYGWELQFTAGTSDKFYRVIVVDTTTVTLWGKRDGAAQIKVYRFERLNQAKAKAVDLTNAKEAKGYFLSRDFTEFEVEPSVLRNLLIAGTEQFGAAALSRAFIVAADRLGTAKPGASR